MKNLLLKEFHLSVHPTSYLFLALASMLLIPNYPYYVAFFYQTLGIFFMFQNGNTTNDIFFSALLPVRKSDVVKARFFSVVILELLQIGFSIPFAILRYVLMADQNMAGMEANIALFGLIFMMYGIFNLLFLPTFYKTAYKVGLPFMLACSAMLIFAGAAEVAVNFVPGWKAALDSIDPASFPQQTLVLVVGILVFGLLSLLAYQKSVDRFERLDL
jgi:hypothetical protein